LVCVHPGALIWCGKSCGNAVRGGDALTDRDFCVRGESVVMWLSLGFWPVELEDRAGCVVRELDIRARANHF
jgi:hypothetical protein